MSQSIFASRTSWVYFVVIFFASSTMAMFLPVSSLFLSRGVGASGWEIGAFFTVHGVLSILVSQLVAKYSDIAGNRRNIILFGCFSGALACLGFAFIRSYWVLAVAVNFLYCFASVAGQVFASGREYSRHKGGDPVFFTSVMRAFFALAWVIGPPAVMIILEKSGFTVVYLCSCAVFLAAMTVVFFLMPSSDFGRDRKEARSAKLFAEPSVLVLCMVNLLVFACNNMYIIAMPQYVTGELNLETRYVGIFMATAAGLEIPCMLISGWLARKLHMKYILIVATASGFLYYIAISCATTLAQFWCAQIANAVCIGIVTSLLMVYFQEMLPRIPGQATTLFSSSISVGNILSGALCGFILENAGSVAVFNAAVALNFLASVLMCFVRKI
ncbi:MAG: sugar efflux transporter [Succinivibrionaceae bacterium]|nr:sugar efflux transporter [Succinivibrionaceae bacterium]